MYGTRRPTRRQGDDVEEGDAPEDLFDGGGQGLARVGGLGGGETDELGAGEGEGGRHEDAYEALEAVVKCAWVRPVLSADIAAGGGATDVDDDAEKAGQRVSLIARCWGKGRTRQSL